MSIRELRFGRKGAAQGKAKALVVLVHGYVCNRGFWAPWMARLRAQGHCVIAPNLEPARLWSAP